MEDNKDFDFIKAQFDSLPAVALPASLTAESLWARMDADQTPEEDAPRDGKVLAFTRRFRPVLSYAAVFVVLVAVYYSAGLDRSPVAMEQMDYAAPQAATAEEPAQGPMLMMASPEMEGTPAPQAAPRMSAMEGNDAGTQNSASPEANPNADTANEAVGYGAVADDSYKKAIDNAVAMENYMVSSLSAKDYGGIYVGTEDIVRLHIWAVNDDAVQAAIAAYQGESCEVVTQAALCSMEEMKIFAGKLERIGLREGEALAAYVSQMDNRVAVNISKAGEERLKSEIAALVQANADMGEAISIFTLDPAGQTTVK